MQFNVYSMKIIMSQLIQIRNELVSLLIQHLVHRCSCSPLTLPLSELIAFGSCLYLRLNKCNQCRRLQQQLSVYCSLKLIHQSNHLPYTFLLSYYQDPLLSLHVLLQISIYRSNHLLHPTFSSSLITCVIICCPAGNSTIFATSTMFTSSFGSIVASIPTPFTNSSCVSRFLLRHKATKIHNR